MKQYRNISIILVMAAIAGCAKLENAPLPEREITFTVGRYATETKAESIIDVDNVTSFSSKAYLYAEGVDGAQNFFGTGETISWDSDTHVWEPSHPYYWPKSSNSYINFISWHDNGGAPTTISETALEWVGRTIGANDNIMFADVAWRYNQNVATYGFNNVVSGVPTLFHHALCRVQINVKAMVTTNPDNANETFEITLQSASLEGVYNNGNMKLVNEDINETGTRAWWSNTSPTLLWNTISSTTSNPYDGVTTNTNVTTAPTAALPLRSFMPQNLADAACFNFVYTLVTKSNGNITASEQNIPVSIVLNKIKNASDMEIKQWLPNRIYTYNIVINPIGQNILLNPTVESDWGFSSDLSATVE